jgi:N-carbamoylputrescine amidase
MVPEPQEMPSSNQFRIGLVQMACGTEPQSNLDHAVSLIRKAAEQGAQIVCLQELFRSQYFCREEDARLFDLAETIPGPSTETLCGVAKELGVVVIASLFEKRATGLYHNTAAVIDADGAKSSSSLRAIWDSGHSIQSSDALPR